jgi:Protein of unknown function (DUF2530)
MVLRRTAHHADGWRPKVLPVPRPTKQAPPPLQVDTARVVLAGTALWTVALVVLLFLGDRVDRLWTWTCVAAIGLAILGLGVMRLQGQLPRQRAGSDDDAR